MPALPMMQEEDRGTFEVTKMHDLHKEIARRLLIGQKAVDIAIDLGITPATVSYTRNSPIVKRQLELMHGARDADAVNFSEDIKRAAGKALILLEDTIDGEVEGQPVPISLRLRAAVDALDRHIPKVAIQKSFNSHLVLTAEDIEELKRRAREAAGEIITVEAQESTT
jgi:hypothetical protein